MHFWLSIRGKIYQLDQIPRPGSVKGWPHLQIATGLIPYDRSVEKSERRNSSTKRKGSSLEDNDVKLLNNKEVIR